ncbi:MAG: hypothetical protein ACRCVX_12580 [Shewanella sp.]
MTDVKAELFERQAPMIKLLLRSPDQGDGWRNVSQVLRKTITNGIAAMPELYETREMAGMQIRLSERGNILKDYL